MTGNGGGIKHTTTVTLTVVSLADFGLSASPASVTVNQGGQGTSTITSTISGGFNSSISLSASGAPTGTTVSLNPGTIPAPGSGQLNADHRRWKQYANGHLQHPRDRQWRRTPAIRYGPPDGDPAAELRLGGCTLISEHPGRQSGYIDDHHIRSIPIQQLHQSLGVRCPAWNNR